MTPVVTLMLLFIATLEGDLAAAIDCPEGYDKFQTSCYKFVYDFVKNYTDAKLACDLESAHLITVQSTDEFNFTVEIIQAHDGDNESYYTGGVKTTEGEFVWDDGTGSTEEFGSSFHLIGDPNAGVGGTQHSVTIRQSGGQWGMDVVPMSLLLPYICEKELECNQGFERFQASCYKFEFELEMNYSSASKACEQDLAHLTTVQSAPEFDFVVSRIQHGTSANYYTAGACSCTWNDGTGEPVIIQNVTIPSETNYGLPRALIFQRVNDIWGINDVEQTRLMTHICEYAL